MEEIDRHSSESEPAFRGTAYGAILNRRFLGSSAILAGSLALALVFYFGYIGGVWVDVIGGWTARWSSFGLNLLGSATRADGTVISSGAFSVNIVAECTAVGPLLLFAGAVAAYPSSLKAKGLGVALGLVVLGVVNLARIMSLFWIGSAYPQYLDMAHFLVWQTGIIVVAVVIWLFWADRWAGVRYG